MPDEKTLQQQWSAVDQYVAEVCLPADAALEAALRNSTDASLPAISVSPAQGKLLHLLARIQGAKKILEIGTLGGYSTIWLARALPADGRLITLEYEPRHAAVAKTNMAAAGLADRVSIRVGAAIDTLPQLQSEAPFDFVFIDANKDGTADYFAWALKLTKAGSIIIVDNVIRGGKITHADSADRSIIGIRRFNELLKVNADVTATTIQTVGSKGYDGFTIVRVDK